MRLLYPLTVLSFMDQRSSRITFRRNCADLTDPVGLSQASEPSLNYPGVRFHDGPIKRQVTLKGVNIELANIGLSISIPEQPFWLWLLLVLLGQGCNTKLLIHPCLCGPFELPAGYVLTSPVYLIETKKKATVQIQHYASLRNERDCEGMVFLFAGMKPQKKQSGHLAYNFKVMEGNFTPDSPIGEVVLHQFCFLASASRSGM